MLTGTQPEFAYSRKMVKAVLENWLFLAEMEAEALVLVRADLSLRMDRLPAKYGIVVRTVIVAGEDAVKLGAVTGRELGNTVTALLRILNEEGLGCKS